MPPGHSHDYEIPAVVVEEGGGIGWVIHPMGARDNHPCDWNPAATGQHCDYTGMTLTLTLILIPILILILNLTLTITLNLKEVTKEQSAWFTR